MSYDSKRFPMLLVIAIVLAFVTGLAYTYFLSQNNLAVNKLSVIDREIADIKTQLDEAKTSTTSSAQTALNTLEVIKQSEIAWSNVIADIQKIIPLDLVDLKPMVEFSTYSGQSNGMLTFNGHTIPSSDIKLQLNSISQTISTFNASPVFGEAFVPSISISVDENDQTMLSFVFNVSYKKQSTSSSTDSANGTVPRK